MPFPVMVIQLHKETSHKDERTTTKMKFIEPAFLILVRLDKRQRLKVLNRKLRRTTVLMPDLFDAIIL